ncbi:MAG: NADH:ubiquinone oxidoreductase subunit [Lasallia pustulata]|uniref:NADH dehydrogenase [ubiquinone] 1 beta subcomplex subunit 4 n=1 Tax=Lasallia pustulata TaxID=136370 RepID=A0A5M8PS92_9LECA|nr:MAG: NADH:ubiquinone oxidoreductase subunit [Lasallia pustulata]
MAGSHNTLAMDPALVKYANMQVNRHKYFRWTPRTAWLTFAYVVAVPAMFGYLGFVTDGKYDMRAKRRGDTIVEF